MKQRARFAAPEVENPQRRLFLQATALTAGGFAVGFGIAPRAEAADAATFVPNPFVRIASNNTVTVVVKHLEMGQGTYTGLPTLVAEELDAAWAQIRVEGAPADAATYNNLLWGRRREPAAAPRSPIRSSSCARPVPRRERCSSRQRCKSGKCRRPKSK